MNINELMNELPPAPADVASWIEDECVQKTYIFYNRKRRKAVCSRCGAEYELDKDGCCQELEGEYMQHDKKLICTACWHDAIAKADGISCANLNEYFRVVIFVKKNNSLYASLSEVIVDFANQGPNISRAFTALYKFNKNEQIYYRRPSWGGWVNMSHNIKLPTPAGSMGWTKFENTYLYARNFDTVFDIPALKYADVNEVYRKHDLTAYGVMDYIPLAMKYRSLELLRKAGYKKIFKEKIIGTGFSRACNWRATSIEKILRVKTKGEAKAIREADLSLRDLLTYQKHYKEQGSCPLECIPILVEFKRRDYIGRNNAAIIETYMDIVSAAEYVVSQNEKFQANQEKDRLSRVTLLDYADYLRECEKLQYNMTKKHTLKPKDLLTAHQRTSKILTEKKDRITATEFRRGMDRITGMKEPFVKDDLLIRPAASAAELRAEGEALGHCVGGYADRVCKGICAILFIRKADSPEDPFYTLELNNKGNVIQCRGKSNRDMTDAVKAFVDTWVKEVVRRYYQNKKKQKAA